MRRFIVIIVAVTCAVFCFAQDVISLMNGNRIENVFVSSKTETEIQYIQNEEILSVPRDSVEAIFHENGNIETISIDLSQDPQFMAMIDSMGLDINYVKQQLDRGVDLQHISWTLWEDENYSDKCRKVGTQAHMRAVGEIALERYKEYKKAGMKNQEAQKQAYTDAVASKVPIKAANEAIRKCAGEL